MTITTLKPGLTSVETRTPVGRPRIDSVDGSALETEQRPIEYTGSRDVIFHPTLMDVGQAYTYRVDGIFCVAVKRENGRLDFFELPQP